MAHTPRLYVDSTLTVGDTLSLPASATKHVISVLRLRTGDPLELFNGDGNAYAASLIAEKKHANASITAVRAGPDTGAAITLALGISRGDRMDYALQKSTELGVACIQPLMTERCSVKLPADRLAKKRQHWHNIIVSASEQCGRCDLPALAEVASLPTWLAQSAPGFVLAPAAARLLSTHPATPMHSVLIGPESGLSDTEIAQAEAAGWERASLGPLVLRTETAASVALTLMRQRQGLL